MILVRVLNNFIVHAHDHFVSKDIDVALKKRDRFHEYVVASAYKIHIEELVVFDNAEDTLIVVDSLLGVERYNNSSGGLSIDSAL